jgi:DNA-directed RNA polymerase specialized sigma24 family protein
MESNMNEKWSRWTEHEPTPAETVERWQRLIIFCAQKIGRTYHLSISDLEDLEQDAIVKLLQLPPAKRPLIGYCRTVINNALRDSLRRLLGRGGTKGSGWNQWLTLSHVEAIAGLEFDNEPEPLDFLGSYPSPEHQLVGSLSLNIAMDAVLTDRERQCVMGDVRTLATRLDTSEAAVRTVRARATKKLRERMVA